jgi:hypothetical protein
MPDHIEEWILTSEEQATLEKFCNIEKAILLRVITSFDKRVEGERDRSMKQNYRDLMIQHQRILQEWQTRHEEVKTGKIYIGQEVSKKGEE